MKRVWFIWVVVLFYACTPVYVPPVVHAPLLQEKKDFQAEVHLGTGGTDLQAAYALTDRVGIRTAVSYQPGFEESHNRHAYLEAATGMYRPLWGGFGLLEGYAGAGFGRGEGYSEWTMTGSPHTRNASANYFRPFVQGNLAFTSDYVDLGVSATTLLLSVSNFTVNEQVHPQTFNDVFIEPALFLRFGYDILKISLQTGVSLPLTEIEEYSWVPLQFSLGLSLRLSFLDED